MKFQIGSKNDPFLQAMNNSIIAYKTARPLGLYDEAEDGYLGKSWLESGADKFGKWVSNAANQVAKKSMKISAAAIDLACKAALKSYEAVKWMGKKVWEGLKVAYNWLSKAIKTAYKAVVGALKKFLALMKKLLFEKICGIAKKKGSLDGFGSLEGPTAKTTIKAIACGFEKHFASPAVKAELIASAIGLLGTFVVATVATGGGAAAAAGAAGAGTAAAGAAAAGGAAAGAAGGAGAGMAAAGAAAALLAGRHAASVIALAFMTGCRGVKNPVDPEKETELTVGEAEGLGQGLLLIGGLAALSVFALSQGGDLSHNLT